MQSLARNPQSQVAVVSQPGIETQATDTSPALVAFSDLRELYLLLRRRMRLLVTITVATAFFALVLSFILPSRYSAETVIMLDPRKTRVTSMEVVSGLTPDVASVRTEVDIIQARTVVDRVIKRLDLLNDPEFNKDLGGFFSQLFGREAPAENEVAEQRSKIAKVLLQNLNVANDGRSYSIALSYSDKDPAVAAKVANAFADEYLVDQLEAKYDMTQRATTWLAGRLEQMRDEVQLAEKAVEDYKTKNNLVGVGEETITQQQLVAINSQLVAARAELSQAVAKLTSTEALVNGKGNLEAATTVLSSPLIQSLKTQEAEVGRKAAELAGRYGDRHPTIINARAELRDIRAKISEEVQKIVQGMRNEVDIQKAKVESLDKELAGAEGRTGAGDQAMVMLRQLQREAAASRSLYEGFLNRYKQVAEQQDLQVADARIIARAEAPLKPYFPNKLLFLILGTLLGGIGGFITILLLEYFDRGFRGQTEIERVAGVSGIGMIPALKDLGDSGPEDYVLAKPLSAYAESLRTVRTAIHFSNVDAPPKVVMVTSSVPGEGKTTFCVSMGRTLAKGGNKVLLIDADMRRPRVRSQSGATTSKPDLAQILAGEASAAAAIQKDTSGMDMIIAHTKTPNPQDLLASHQMERLLESLRPNYDLILIDTPPVMAVADAAMVAKVADTSLYLVRWATTPREVVLQGLKLLRSFNIRLAGVVLTQVDLDQQAQYGYGDYGTYYGRYKEYYTN